MALPPDFCFCSTFFAVASRNPFLFWQFIKCGWGWLFHRWNVDAAAGGNGNYTAVEGEKLVKIVKRAEIFLSHTVLCSKAHSVWGYMSYLLNLVRSAASWGLGWLQDMAVSSLIVLKKSLKKIRTCLLTKRNVNEKIPTVRHTLVLQLIFWVFFCEAELL